MVFHYRNFVSLIAISGADYGGIYLNVVFLKLSKLQGTGTEVL